MPQCGRPATPAQIRANSAKYSSWAIPTYWWIATYAFSRSYPVDSQRSSAAAKRTSTGNAGPTGSRRARSPTDASTSGSASRGTAYSLSRNRTLRVVANIRNDASEDSRRLITRPTSRCRPGS